MLLRVAAFAALAIAPCLTASAQSPTGVRADDTAVVPTLDDASRRVSELTLDDAFQRVSDSHPDLRLFNGQRRVLDAEQAEASLRPERVIGAEIEGLVLNDSAQRTRAIEATLTLASVYERGGKLDARRALVQRRIDALSLDRERARVDLLAETARRYLALVFARQQSTIATREIGQRQRMVAAARQRFQAGASPESVILSAQASLAQAELQAARAAQQFDSARRSLAVLWGDVEPAFQIPATDPLQLPRIEAFSALRAGLERTPELLQFNDRQRIAESRLQLARTQATPDVSWQVGARYGRENGDVSLLGGFSVPLGQRARAQPGIQAAQAEMDMLSLERESGALSLLATLADAHGRYLVAQDEVQRLQRDVLPRLARAETATERAWRAGAVSYLEWWQLQDERTAALRQQLDAALEAQTALIEIQRLTGHTLIVGPAADASEPLDGATP
ncbi:TolC family protein [Luteimonas sp. RIT-PG2_3]